MHRMIGLALTALVTLVAGFDSNISNGTCYFGQSEEAADSYIPCGNAAGGVQSCCQARDICLSSNACYNNDFGTTYLAGCTDESYGDDACPYKGDFPEQQWVGLVRCFVSDDDQEEWAPCEEPAQPTLNSGNKQCSCDTASSTAVFTGAATLTPYASLPVKAGNDIAWYPGFTPTNSDTTTTSSSTGVTTTSTSTTSASTTSDTSETSQRTSTPTSSTETTTPTSSSTSSTSLSTAAKAGIGVGTVVGALAVAGMLFWLILYHRRTRHKQDSSTIEDQIQPYGSASQPTENGTQAGGNMTEHQASWGGKSELPTEANEIGIARSSFSTAAVAGSTINTPATTYQPYHVSPVAGPSEAGGSPAASSSGLVPKTSGYEKPAYESQIFEMPG